MTNNARPEPTQFVILREADGENRFIESNRIDFTDYEFLRSSPIAGIKKEIIVQEWCHKSVHAEWLQIMVSEMFETRDTTHDTF